MTINKVNDRCKMTKEYCMHTPMHPLETKLNIIFSENPHLLDENKNIILIKKNLKHHLISNKYLQIYLYLYLIICTIIQVFIT